MACAAVSANATNTFASCSGHLSGAWAFHSDLARHRRELPRFLAASLRGGIFGAWLLLKTPESVFRDAAPCLMLFAFGGRLNEWLTRLGSLHRHASVTG